MMAGRSDASTSSCYPMAPRWRRGSSSRISLSRRRSRTRRAEAPGEGGRAQFRVRRIDRHGTRSAAVTVAGIAGNRASGYPRVAVANGEVVFAWTESVDGGGLQVRTSAARLP